MSKKQLILSSILSALFTLSLFSLFFFFTLQENRQLAHFYFANSGGNATVTLGSFRLGSAPIKNYTLPAGWYNLTIATDYYTYTLPLRLSGQTATVVDWQVSPSLETSSGIIYELIPTLDPSSSSLAVITAPDRAMITLDSNISSNDSQLYSPATISDLAPGTYSLTLSLPGYHSLQIPFTLTPGYQLKLTVKLAQN